MCVRVLKCFVLNCLLILSSPILDLNILFVKILFLQVIKDSKKLLNKWQYLKIDTIRLIETACEEFMRTFNYEVYEAAN